MLKIRTVCCQVNESYRLLFLAAQNAATSFVWNTQTTASSYRFRISVAGGEWHVNGNNGLQPSPDLPRRHAVTVQKCLAVNTTKRRDKSQ